MAQELPQHFTGPYRTDKWGIKIYCTTEKGGDWTPCLDIRGWGYLTGNGHGALALPMAEATAEQKRFADWVVERLNGEDQQKS